MAREKNWWFLKIWKVWSIIFEHATGGYETNMFLTHYFKTLIFYLAIIEYSHII